jgi:hypothetical protein
VPLNPRITLKVIPTTELCGEPYNPKDPASPRCVVIKDDHQGRKHQALAPGGKVLTWGPPPISATVAPAPAKRR